MAFPESRMIGRGRRLDEGAPGGRASRGVLAARRLARRTHEWLARHHLDRRGPELAAWTVVGALLAFGALAGLGWVAGFDRFAQLFRNADWIWLAPAFGAQLAAYLGYTAAYRELVRVEGGRVLDVSHVLASVASGFGVFIPHGGLTADYHALVDCGFEPEQARLRVLGLGALEYAVLAPAACACALYVLAGSDDVPWSFTLPWAIGVPAGTALALAAGMKLRQWQGRDGWRGRAAQGLDLVVILNRLAGRPRDHGAAAGFGMAVYWAGDVFCLWACLRVFLGHPPTLAPLLIAYATGYALTRRTLPLAGAGAVELLLPLALVWVRLPLAPALLAVLAYRAFNLWLPLPPALAGRRRLLRARADEQRGSSALAS